jgi:hypothetical protein
VNVARSNKERQKAYRERRRAARNGTVTPAIGPAEGVTGGSPSKDYIGDDGFERIYLGDFGFGPQYAMVLPEFRLADPPDPEDDWSPVVYGQTPTPRQPDD